MGRTSTYSIVVVAVCLVGIAPPAWAQESTRRAAAQAAREVKAATGRPWQPGKVERFVTFLEHDLTSRVLAPSDGFGVRLGSIEGGAGLALGGSWRHSRLWSGNAALSVSAAGSIGGDTEITATLAVPHLGSHRVALVVDGARTRLPQQRFFGLGPATLRSDETSFGLDRDRIGARGVVAVTRWLSVEASAGVLDTATTTGSARTVPSLEARFTPADAPAFSQRTRFGTASVAATIDNRDVPGNPRAGGRYHLAVSRFADRAQRQSFTQLAAEVEQHVSVWTRQRLFTLRGMAVSSITDGGGNVPFHLQPTLGGSRVLRGFVTNRFRDRNVLAVQAEYGWDVLPFLSAVAFVEAGSVIARWRDFDFESLRTDYGLGFRFGSARTVAFRTDVAFGSGEGTRLTMRFNHAF
jgi:outer membrane protein assembly factor BamA